MDQVDDIIIPVLRDLGCSFDDKIQSFSQFDSDIFVEAIGLVLQNIDAKYKIPTKLPTGRASRFKHCRKISEAFEDLGYVDQLGFQIFLYPNENDVRKLMIWAFEKLPRSDEADDAPGISSGNLMDRLIMQGIQSWHDAPWNPYPSAYSDYSSAPHPLATAPLDVPISTDSVSQFRLDYVKNYQPLLVAQPIDSSRQFAASVFELNAREFAVGVERDDELGNDIEEGSADKKRAQLDQLIANAFRSASAQHGAGEGLQNEAVEALFVKGHGADQSKKSQKANDWGFSRRAAFEQESKTTSVQVQDSTDGSGGAEIKEITDDGTEVKDEQQRKEEEEALQKQRDQELHDAAEQVKRMTAVIQKLRGESDTIVQQERQVDAQIQSETRKKPEGEAQYLTLKRVSDLLPDAKNNLAKLEKIAEDSSKRILKYGEEWEVHRAPLVEQIRSHKQRLADQKEEMRLKIAEIKRMRSDAKVLASDIRQRDAYRKQLAEDLKRLPKSVNRQVYVRRIMDIMHNLEKQKIDIKKILEDIRSLQKEINTVSETSKRSFGIVDDMVFKAAQAKGKSKSKKDAGVSEDLNAAYKLLVSMKENFNSLVDTIEKTGTTTARIQDVEQRIEAANARNTSLNYERVSKDLKQVKAENDAMKKKITKLRSKLG